MASFSCDAMPLLAMERTPWLHPWCVWENFFHLILISGETLCETRDEKVIFWNLEQGFQAGLKITAETLGINKIVVSWQHWLHLIGPKGIESHYSTCHRQSNFNGFENCVLTLQPARDSTANVQPMRTLPISIFIQVCHYRGGSRLLVGEWSVAHSYDCRYVVWYIIYGLYIITIFNTIMPWIPTCFFLVQFWS